MIKVHKPQSRQSYLLCYCRPFGRLSLSLSTHFGDVLNQVRCVSENRIKLPTVTSSSEESLIVPKDFSLFRVITTPYQSLPTLANTNVNHMNLQYLGPNRYYTAKARQCVFTRGSSFIRCGRDLAAPHSSKVSESAWY